MDAEVKPEKYRKLSVASLVTGILAISLAGLYSFLWVPLANFLQNSIAISTIPYIMISFI